VLKRFWDRVAGRVVRWADHRVSEQRRDLAGVLRETAARAEAYHNAVVDGHNRAAFHNGMLLEVVNALVLRQGGEPVALSADLRASAHASPDPVFDEAADGTLTVRIPDDGWEDTPLAEDGDEPCACGECTPAGCAKKGCELA
jgi:hypothetical protein